jgi:hypothetical protein
MIAPDDNYPVTIEAAVRAFVGSGVEAGRDALEPIAYPPRAILARPSLSRITAGRIFKRDAFRCRYCGCETIPTPILQIIAGVYPGVFPYHPNWKGGVTHPAISTRSPVVDHVVPGAHGGDWLDDANLVTACWPCNVRKADLTLAQLGWTLKTIPHAATWDGLTGLYRALWEAAGSPRPAYHRAWMRAFGA